MNPITNSKIKSNILQNPRFVKLLNEVAHGNRNVASRSKRMDLNKDVIENVDGKTGNVILNHKN